MLRLQLLPSAPARGDGASPAWATLQSSTQIFWKGGKNKVGEDGESWRRIWGGLGVFVGCDPKSWPRSAGANAACKGGQNALMMPCCRVLALESQEKSGLEHSAPVLLMVEESSQDLNPVSPQSRRQPLPLHPPGTPQPPRQRLSRLPSSSWWRPE